MKRPILIVGIVGFLIAVGFKLLPRWRWTAPGSDCIGCQSKYAFAWQPPTPGASIDASASAWCIVVTLTVGIVLCLRQRASDQQAHAYWRSQWDYAADHADTLLRASDIGIEQSEVLLRAAREQETPKEELLRITIQP